MPTAVHCRDCSYRFRVADEYQGKSIRCPNCQGIVKVPGARTGGSKSRSRTDRVSRARHSGRLKNLSTQRSSKSARKIHRHLLVVGISVFAFLILAGTGFILIRSAQRSDSPSKDPELVVPADNDNRQTPSVTEPVTPEIPVVSDIAESREITTKDLQDAEPSHIVDLPEPSPVSLPESSSSEPRSKGLTFDREAAQREIKRTAEVFYAGLRGPDRYLSRQQLTKKAQVVSAAKQSPLSQLPAPETGKDAVNAGEVELEDDVAVISVEVRAGGRLHPTRLHLRYEQDLWRVFAVSARYPDGEKSINFEAPVAPQEQRPGTLQALLGKPLDLSGYTINGTPLNISEFGGKIVLVDFWATWCGPCIREIPNILANWEEYHDDGFEVIAISVDRDLKKLRSFVAAENPPWTVVADNHPKNRTSMSRRYGIRGIPAFILIGQDGNVAAVNCRGAQLGREIDRLIRERGASVSRGGSKTDLVPQTSVAPNSPWKGRPAKNLRHVHLSAANRPAVPLILQNRDFFVGGEQHFPRSRYGSRQEHRLISSVSGFRPGLPVSDAPLRSFHQ